MNDRRSRVFSRAADAERLQTTRNAAMSPGTIDGTTEKLKDSSYIAGLLTPGRLPSWPPTLGLMSPWWA